MEEGMSVNKARQILSIKSSTAKLIVRTFKQTGTIKDGSKKTEVPAVFNQHSNFLNSQREIGQESNNPHQLINFNQSSYWVPMQNPSFYFLGETWSAPYPVMCFFPYN